MDAPWVFCGSIEPGEVTLSPEESGHLTRSLRRRTGDAVVLFDGRGGVASGQLTDAGEAGSRKAGRGAPSARVVVERVERHRQPSATLELLVAAPKGDRLTWLVEKCTELGVARLTLVNFERSVVQVDARHADRLQRTALEACKQAHRAWLPAVAAADWQERVAESGAHVAVADPNPRHASLAAWLHGLAHVSHSAVPQDTGAADRGGVRVAGLIGPEGGFGDAEKAQFDALSLPRVRLAAHTLRIETAAVAFAAVFEAVQLGRE